VDQITSSAIADAELHLKCQLHSIVYRNNAIPAPAAASATTPLLKVAVLDNPDVAVMEGASTLSVEEDRPVVGATRLSLPPVNEEIAVLVVLCVPEAAVAVPADVADAVVLVLAVIVIAGRS
jgi:hypothetical protein